MNHWKKLDEGLFQLNDSCLIYAVQGPEGTVLINAGTGLAAESLEEVASGEVTVLLTHHFRDHTDGAIRLHEAGATVFGPYWDQDYLVDPEQCFRERQVWNSYDNRWDRFGPVRPIPVSGWMMDYEKRSIAGLEWEVVPTPGVTNGAVSYVVELNGQRLAFVGEVICGHGKTGRLAPLQYNYNDFTGATNLWHSSRRLMQANVHRLLPSLGETIDDVGGAIEQFRTNLKRLSEINPGFAGSCVDPDANDIEEVLPHLYRSKYANAQTHFVISESGKILTIDYGYNTRAYASPGKHHLSNRRPFLHGMDGLRETFGAEKIDAVLVSHFHDDHVNGMPMLQRLFDAEIMASEVFSDLLERPMRYDRPCLWHEPMDITKVPTGETFEWEGIPFTLHPMSGHTRFATLICFEIDGTRVAHTGDQIFFSDPNGGAYSSEAKPFTNHVYKNGLDIGCYKQTLKHLKNFKPELVLTGHTHPYRPDEHWESVIESGAISFDEVHEALMILGDGEAHFGAESQGGKLKPYHAMAEPGESFQFEGWILNPLGEAATASIKLIAPDGWEGESAEVELGLREQKDISLRMQIPAGTQCRRQPVALDLTVGGKPFGQVAEALVTVGCERF